MGANYSRNTGQGLHQDSMETEEANERACTPSTLRIWKEKEESKWPEKKWQVRDKKDQEGALF